MIRLLSGSYCNPTQDHLTSLSAGAIFTFHRSYERVQPDGPRVPGGSLSDIPSSARRGPRPSQSARLLGAHPVRGRGGGAARPALPQWAAGVDGGGALRRDRAAGRGALDAGPRSAGSNAAAEPGEQGFYPAGRGGARAPDPDVL